MSLTGMPKESDITVAMLPAQNPLNRYNSLLIDSLREHHVTVTTISPRPDRVIRRPDVDVVHTHWPENLMVRPSTGLERRARSMLASRAVLLTRRLIARHGIGFVHTLHNSEPHDPQAPESAHRLLRRVARDADVLIVHSAYAAQVAREELGRVGPIVEAPHGHYIGVYPPSSADARATTRRALGIPEAAPVAIAFGQMRANKRLPPLVRAARSAHAGLHVLVAGSPRDPATVEALEALATTDAHVHVLARHVPDEQVGDLFAASDVSLHGQTEIFTSGAAILALSLGVPVVVPRSGSAPELGEPPAVVAYDGDDPTAAIRGAVAADRTEARDAALAAARRLDWGLIGTRHRAAYDEAIVIAAQRMRKRP